MTTPNLYAFNNFDWSDGANQTGVVGSNNFSTPKPSNDDGFFSGTNLMGLLQTIGGTWAQIESAKAGKPVVVQSANGQQQDIAPMLMQKLEEQAKANNTSANNLMQMMQMQILQNNAEKDPPKKDNTALYIGIGVGAIVLIGGMIFLTQKK